MCVVVAAQALDEPIESHHTSSAASVLFHGDISTDLRARQHESWEDGDVPASDEGYEQRARHEIERWKGKKPSGVITALNKPADFLGFPIRKLLETDRGGAILERVIGPLFDAGTWRQDTAKVLDAYRARGHDVAQLSAIRSRVPLRDMDDEAKKHRVAATVTLTIEGGIVGPAMAAAATLAGAAAAAATIASGGTGAPAAAAAGLAVVATATVAETTFLIGFCCRRLASIAASYGFDVADDRERAFALQVLNVATAENLAAKETALADLGNLAGRLGLKQQPWKKLEDKSVIAKVVRQLADQVGWKITQAQLRRVLTVVGAVLGAGFNGHLGYSVTRAGYFLYRERVLDETSSKGSFVEGEGETINADEAEEGARHAVPLPVQAAVARWRERGSPHQGATMYKREAWIQRFPEFHDVIAELPAELDRAAVSREVARLENAPDWPLSSFVVTQIWGYGTRGYGPARVRAVLDEAGERARPALAESVRRLRAGAPEDGLEVLAGEDHRLKGLGMSFATKFLFFMDPRRRALVLDDFVAGWLKDNAGLRLTLYPLSKRHYGRYLEAMHGWAHALGLEPAALEEVLFAEAANSRPRSDWSV